MQKVGTINGQIKSMDPTLLSPDGNYLLTRTVNLATTFEIYSTANGQRVSPRQRGFQGCPSSPMSISRGNDQMVTVKDSIKEKLVQVWDLKTGTLRKQIDARAVSFDPKAYAVSPGGRYLAMVNESKLSVFDLRGRRPGRHDPGPGSARNPYLFTYQPGLFTRWCGTGRAV